MMSKQHHLLFFFRKWHIINVGALTMTGQLKNRLTKVNAVITFKFLYICNQHLRQECFTGC